MSVPRKMSEFAAGYGCEIIEKSSMEGDELYAKAKDSGCERFICHSYNARFTNLAKLTQVLQDVTGRTLAQFWTHKTGEEVVQEVQTNKQRGMKKEQ